MEMFGRPSEVFLGGWNMSAHRTRDKQRVTQVETLFILSVPNNIKHWQVFYNDDEQILRFIHCEEKFGFMMEDNSEAINEKQI
jgi:hypothetical protein